MSSRSEVETFAIRAAREYARMRGLRLIVAFDDSLWGDVARLQILRRIRQSYPALPKGELDALVEGLLTP